MENIDTLLEKFAQNPEYQPLWQSYTILANLGREGIAANLLAETKDHRRVIIKLLWPTTPDNWEEFRGLFLQEAAHLKRLDHPNKVRLVECNEEIPYLVLEPASGITLRQWLQEKGNFAPPQALEILRPIAEVLTEAHRLGIVHGNIRPETIFIEDINGLPSVKLLDLGGTKLPLSNNEEELERLLKMVSPSELVSTFAYLSPEQSRFQEVDEKTDIYNLGLILYEMLAGYPFDIKYIQDPNLLRLYIINEPISALHDRNAAIPGQFSQVVQRSLAKRKEERQESCLELIEELERSLGYIILDRRFKLLKEIQRSVNYSLYKVKDLTGGLLVPLQAKVFDPEKSQHILLDDINFFAQIEHKNLVKIVTHGRCIDSQALYFIYEEVTGETLETLFQRQFRFDLPSVVGYGIQISEVILRYHEKGSSVYYKYMMPANVILSNFEDGYGTIKILNRILFRDIVTNSAVLTTQLAEVNAYYFSPERVLNEDYDGSHQDDIYAIGVILAKMLLTEHFEVKSSKEQKIFYLETYAKNSTDVLVKKLAEVIIKCLAINPSERHKNIGRVLSDLNRLYLTINALNDKDFKELAFLQESEKAAAALVAEKAERSEPPLLETFPSASPEMTTGGMRENTIPPLTTSELPFRYANLIVALMAVAVVISLLLSTAAIFMFSRSLSNNLAATPATPANPTLNTNTNNSIRNGVTTAPSATTTPPTTGSETPPVDNCQIADSLFDRSLQALAQENVVSLNPGYPLGTKTALEYFDQIRKLCPQSSNGDKLKQLMLEYYDKKIAQQPRTGYFKTSIRTYEQCQQLIRVHDRQLQSDISRPASE
jgi:serine/threonine protein kinase